MAHFKKDTFSRVSLVFLFLISGMIAVSATGNALLEGDVDKKTMDNAMKEIQLISEEQAHISEKADGSRSKIEIINESIRLKELEIERDKKLLELEEFNIQVEKQKWQEKSGEIKGIKKTLGITDEVIHNVAEKKIILENVFFTSYNPEKGQTDSTPCIAGGTGFNLCDMAKEGKRTIALSQELIKWSIYGKDTGFFSAGDIVRLESTDYPNDPRCNGEFIVSDAMNARYTKRGDIFFMSRDENISCKANIYY